MANPRGRPRKDAQVDTVNTKEVEVVNQEQYAHQFAKAMQSAMGNPYIFNPIWQNNILKDINMTPHAYKREDIEKFLANPRQNEKALRDLSQYLFNFVTQYKQLITYFAELLSFDCYLVPMNADEEDVKTKPFQKSHSKALNWLEDFNVKLQCPNMARAILLEDAKFYYLRESSYGTYLQEMPQDYCMISSKNELGYQYSFNMMYFLKPNINFDDYAPEFRQYYNDFLANKDSKLKNPISGVTIDNKYGKFNYWQELDPAKAWTFKFDENVAGISPPFMGLFVDAIEITTYKNLLKTKTALDVTQIILNKIPLAENKGGNTKDNFAILADTAVAFSAIMQAGMPNQNLKVLTSPLDAKVLNFQQAETKDSIVGLGSSEFWGGSGATRLFGEAGLQNAGIQASLKSDANFVKNLYRKFERFLTFQLKHQTGKYRFRVVLEGTEFDREERFERAMKVAAIGGAITYVAVAMGKSAEEFNSLLLLEGVLGLKGRMIPPISAHTQSNKNGAPKQNAEDVIDPNRQE